jgi:hypothetical protein
MYFSHIEILLGQADTLERLQRSKGPGTQACMGNGCYSGLHIPIPHSHH